MSSVSACCSLSPGHPACPMKASPPCGGPTAFDASVLRSGEKSHHYPGVLLSLLHSHVLTVLGLLQLSVLLYEIWKSNNYRELEDKFKKQSNEKFRCCFIIKMIDSLPQLLSVCDRLSPSLFINNLPVSLILSGLTPVLTVWTCLPTHHTPCCMRNC